MQWAISLQIVILSGLRLNGGESIGASQQNPHLFISYERLYEATVVV